MKTESSSNNTGDISVDNEVIKNIALKAGTAVNGIHEIKRTYLRRILNAITKKNRARGVRLEFINDSDVKITLKLRIEYGMNIPLVAAAAQENVKKTVEHMTGLNVTEVAVKITGMQTKDTMRHEGELEKDLSGELFSVKDDFASGHK